VITLCLAGSTHFCAIITTKTVPMFTYTNSHKRENTCGYFVLLQIIPDIDMYGIALNNDITCQLTIIKSKSAMV